MAFTYEDVATTLVENTTMRIRLRDGVPYQYLITPNENYVLHDNTYDYIELDADGNPIEDTRVLGYRTSTASCAYAYDFTVNPRGFYAVLRSEVPENQIFGGGDNNVEIM